MSDGPITSIEIYIPLLDEGTDVWRPTLAEVVGPQEFLVPPTPDYDPDDEHWGFPPGSVVECAVMPREGGDVLVARKLVR
ncbi:MAG: hypothetical protein ACYC5H_12250 [Methylovirgula sp.]